MDFHYENGDGDETKSFDFSINGGDSVTLSELVEVLGILDGTKYENIEAFLDAVEDVRFSDDSLVSVTKDGNDWILTSLQSFTSNEELTITMNDGQVFTVLVTDPPGGPSNESSNLYDFLNKVTVSGASVVDGKYVVEKGKTYTVTLTFKETPQHQFDNDGTLTYTLPEGVTIPSETTNTIKIAIVSGGKTYEIPATVTVNTDGTVTVKFDETDPNYFRLADSTKVVITYNAMVVGNGSVNYKNVVEANGVTETVDKTTNINIVGEGDGATADLSVVKLDGYDASKKLSGVRFKLYNADLTESGEQYDLSLDNSGVYEKILTTDENGVLKIDGTQINIYFGVKYYLEEVAAPEGYQNISFKYQFTLTDDMDHVDYSQYVYFYSDSFQIKNWPLEGLVVGKSVESDDESDHTKEFTFEVSILTESGGVDTSVNGTYGDMTFSKWLTVHSSTSTSSSK